MVLSAALLHPVEYHNPDSTTEVCATLHAVYARSVDSVTETQYVWVLRLCYVYAYILWSH